MKTTLKIIAASFISGVAGVYTGSFLIDKGADEPNDKAPAFHSVGYSRLSPADDSSDAVWPTRDRAERTVIEESSSEESAAPEVPAVDFTEAARRATPSVVYINSISQGISYSYWDWMFGESPGRQRQLSSGSGVIFTSDGYIVTNNHVVASAERIEVNYNKRVYQAELVGTDPSTDLAVIKIDATDLPAIAVGRSSEVSVGEWVIAVGNPFSLASTVTAGIVSAKGRRIGVLKDKFPIESFIQTDAAINPGNSGGALVNTRGELVGINTAILSRTGSYTGYAFAVPVDIARKVFSDLVKYGIVQRAVFGGTVVEYDYANARKYNLDTQVESFDGVLVAALEREGPAYLAGLRPGDVITHIDDVAINAQSEFEEELSYRSPGDEITVRYRRDKKSASINVRLVNTEGTSEIVRRDIVAVEELGAHLEATQHGVRVFRITENSVLRKIGIPENFTIMALNRVRVKKPEEVVQFFKKHRGRGWIYGMNTSRQQMEIPVYIR